MKSYIPALFFFLSLTALATPVKVDQLTSFADKYLYKDNRSNLEKEKMYSASKGCCTQGKTYFVIEGFSSSSDFRQIALYCDTCGVKAMTMAQVALCQSEFSKLHEHLFGQRLDPAIVAKIQPSVSGKGQVVSKMKSKQRIRVSTGSLKCDSAGGQRIRVDLFPL